MILASANTLNWFFIHDQACVRVIELTEISEKCFSVLNMGVILTVCEITKKLLGIIYQCCQTIRTKIREWTIRLADVSKDNVFEECFSVGGANAPPLEFCQ